jgi:outer membrane protein TolC
LRLLRNERWPDRGVCISLIAAQLMACSVALAEPGTAVQPAVRHLEPVSLGTVSANSTNARKDSGPMFRAQIPQLDTTPLLKTQYNSSSGAGGNAAGVSSLNGGFGFSAGSSLAQTGQSSAETFSVVGQSAAHTSRNEIAQSEQNRDQPEPIRTPGAQPSTDVVSPRVRSEGTSPTTAESAADNVRDTKQNPNAPSVQAEQNANREFNSVRQDVQDRKPENYGDTLGGPITLNGAADVIDHEKAKTLQLSPVYLSRAIEMSSFDVLHQETSFSQSITLRDAINYVLDQGMQIKISRESMNYQHLQTLSNYAGFLPTYQTLFNLSGYNVLNFNVTSLSRVFQTGFSFPVFQGGAVVYGLLAQRYREKAWREAYRGTVSDVFLDVYKKYTNLLLQRILMQTWAKSVEADEEQLKNAQSRYKNGTGTRYTVMQVDAQLSADRQSFLQQAVAMRQAGLALNLALNFPISVNLVPAEMTLTEAELFRDNVALKQLLDDTLKFSPGLRQYEYFRLTAQKTIQTQYASLYPTVSFFGLYQITDSFTTPVGQGQALGGAASSAIASFLNSSFSGRVSNNGLGQLYSFSPTAGNTSTQGANTGPSAVPASSGGTPIAQVQSGSLVSSGAVAPSIFGGGNGASSGSNTNGSLQAPSGIFPGVNRQVQGGVSFTWTLPNFGMSTVATAQAVRVLARQALLQCNQELSLVMQQVRGDYLSLVQSRQEIDTAAAQTKSTKEQLTLARSRLDNGVGTDYEVIQAQRDYVSSLTSQAQAIVNANVAQAQLLHDMGIISASTLTAGYVPGQFEQPKPTSARHWFSKARIP